MDAKLKKYKNSYSADMTHNDLKFDKVIARAKWLSSKISPKSLDRSY